MNSTGGALNFDAMIRDTDFNRTIQNMERRIIGFTDKTITETQKMDSAFSQLGRAAAGYFAFTELSQLPGKIVQVRGEFQQLEISFNTMLGSKAKADKLMADVVKFAAVTPYGLKDTAAATKQLLAYGEGADTVTSTLRKLGDIASGINAPLGDIAYLYGTTMTQGRLYTQDLNQFTGRGIPMIKELAAIFKVAEKDVKGLVEAGKVGFPEVQQVIENLTASGSMFGGLMEAQSKSLPGLIAQLEDAIDMMFNDIGKANEGLAAGVITGATSIVENYQEVIDILKVIVATYGAYRAALISIVAVQKLQALNLFVTEYMAMGKALGFATANQIAFNRAVLANPYAIAAAAIIGLITAVNVFKEDTSEAAKAQERIANSTDKVNESLAGELSKVQLLTTQIKNENVSREERNKKLNELISLHPKILGGITQENIATAEGTKAINAYIEARKRQIEVEQLNLELTDSIKRQLDAKNGKKELSFMSSLALSMSSAGGSGLTAGTGTDFTAATVSARKKLNTDVVKQEAELQKTILERVNALNSADSAIDKNSAKTEQSVKKSVEWYDQEIKALKEKQSKEADNRNSFLAYQKQIDDLEKQRTRIVGVKATKSDAAKIAQEENQVAVKSLEEQLEDKKKMYELYYKWVEYYGIESADKQFGLLLSKNKSFVDYLRSEIAQIEKDKATPGIGIIGPEESYLVKLRSSLNELTGVDTPMQKFAKDMEDARESAGSLSEYLEILRKKQQELSGKGDSPDVIGQRQSVAEGIIATEKELRSNLTSFLNASGTYTQQRANIELKYVDLVNAARKKASGKELEDTLGAIETKRKAEIEALDDETFEKSDAYKKIHKEYLDYGHREIKERIKNIESALEKEKMSAATRKKLEMDLAATRRELSKNTADGFREAASIMNTFLGEVDLKISKNFSISMKQISQAMDNVANLMDDSASTASQVGSIVGIVSFVITSARDAMLSAEDLHTQMDDQQSYYENIKNELAGINMLLERQKELLDDLSGINKAEGVKSLYENYGKQQEDLWNRLKDLQVDMITSQKEIFVDPVLGTKKENKGFVGWWTQVMTGGQVKTKIVYEFESVNTDGYKDIEDYRNLLAEIKKGGGKLYGKEVVDADIKALEELIEAYDNAVEQQKNLMEELKAYFTGTTAASIADAIVSGFQQGKRSAEDFASDFESMMTNAIMQSFKARALEDRIATWYEEFSQAALSGYSLDSGEIADLKNKYNGIITDAAKEWDLLQQIAGFNIGVGNNKALTGAIKSISEETASVIAGQMNAMRIMQADTNQIMRTQLFHIIGIEANTSRLRQIEISLISIDRKLGNDPSRAKGLSISGIYG